MNMTETVQLWIDNDQGYYNAVLDAVRDAGSDRYQVAAAIQHEVEAFLPPLDGLAQDLVTHALWDVNWDDLATDYLEVIADEYEDDYAPSPLWDDSTAMNLNTSGSIGFSVSM